ncbi:hypothetical protein QTP88_006840 [Uroleucon formosanum]
MLKIFSFISYWYMRYLLVTELYLVEKWESLNLKLNIPIYLMKIVISRKEIIVHNFLFFLIDKLSIVSLVISTSSTFNVIKILMLISHDVFKSVCKLDSRIYYNIQEFMNYLKKFLNESNIDTIMFILFFGVWYMNKVFIEFVSNCIA